MTELLDRRACAAETLVPPLRGALPAQMQAKLEALTRVNEDLNRRLETR